MRLTTKGPGTGALLFLPLVLAFGCGAPQTGSPTPTTGPRPFVSAKQEQMVFVSLVGGKPVPSVNPVQLKRGQGHVAYWVFCGDGELTITLKDPAKDPFKGSFENNGGNHVRSSGINPDAHDGLYSYTITLKLPGQEPVSNDPEVEIMP